MDIIAFLGIAGTAIIGSFVGLVVLLWLVGFRIIRSDRVGIVEKWWSPRGSLKDQIIALKGEAGYQPDVLRGGIHFRTPLMYKVHTMPLVTIPQGKIGYVFARDGVPLEGGQTLGRMVPGNTFQGVRFFLENGGQRGPQRQILREGTYAFNLAMFVVVTESQVYYLHMGDTVEMQTIQSMAAHLASIGGFAPVIIKGADDKTGIVTVHDGPSLPSGDIIAPAVGDKAGDPNHHN
ncbi:MAG: flotillin family protein, partial [Actinobacteria bacterium]